MMGQLERMAELDRKSGVVVMGRDLAATTTKIGKNNVDVESKSSIVVVIVDSYLSLAALHCKLRNTTMIGYRLSCMTFALRTWYLVKFVRSRSKPHGTITSHRENSKLFRY